MAMALLALVAPTVTTKLVCWALVTVVAMVAMALLAPTATALLVALVALAPTVLALALMAAVNASNVVNEGCEMLMTVCGTKTADWFGS